jgi:ABC-type multidrug transport system fused ATPase/permease subunit
LISCHSEPRWHLKVTRTFVKTTRRILGLIAPYRGAAAIAFALTALACVLNLLVPIFIQKLVDGMVGDQRAWPALACGLLGVFALQAIVAVVIANVIGPVGLGVVRDLRHALYAKILRLGLPFYERTPAGAIVSRLLDDVAVVQALITTQALAILTDLATTTAVLGLLTVYDRGVALVAVVILGVYGLTFRFFSARIKSGTMEVREQLDRVFGQLKERIDGVLVVRAYAREQAEITEFVQRISDAHRPRVRIGNLAAALSNLSVALNGIGTTLVFSVAAFEALGGRMSPGEAIATAALAGLLFGPVARLADLMTIFDQARASVDRLAEILDLNSDVQEPLVPCPFARARGLVEFDRVGFAYKPGQPVLRDIQLRVEPSMKVALVGPTGCGKSSLMNLFLRFYDPSSGEIRLDGIPLHRLRTADLRRQIAVVPQEPVIFAQTLAENIRYGAADADFSSVQRAARAALVHDFAIALPRSYETMVGEGGHKLSQGERQRLAIARAFCKNSPVIILDEATSSLDTMSEAQIQKALANLLAGRTAFIIAHRLATVVDADLIVVIEAGRIVQKGRHEELLADRYGLYAQLAASQFKGGSADYWWRPDEGTVSHPRLARLDRAGSADATHVTQEAWSA